MTTLRRGSDTFHLPLLLWKALQQFAIPEGWKPAVALPGQNVQEPAAGKPAAPVAGLSPRQHEILRLLLKGAGNKTIARELNIGETTVETHLMRLLNRLQVSNRMQVVVWALNHGYVDEQSCSAASICTAKEA